MKIVVAHFSAPWPIMKGNDRLIMNLLGGLAVNHEVTLVTMALSADSLDRLREIETPRIAVSAIVAPNKRSPFHRLYYKSVNNAKAVLTGVPAQVGYAAPGELLRLIADTAKEWAADIVLASYWHLYRLSEYVDASRLVLITHDLDFLVNRGRLRSLGGIGRIIAANRLRAMERIERKAYERYDTILTVTPSDAETLARDPVAAGKAVYALPLALDLSTFDHRSFERERNTILLMGTFHSDFNRDALRYFAGEVLPRVLEKNREARFVVVGYGVDGHLRAAAGPNVSFAGGVDDVRPHLGRCSVMVLPLRFGGGVRIRMMEAAAMGTPVVSTPVGVAGMGLVAGRDYLEAASSADMASVILRVLEDGECARRIGANARRWAEDNISMEGYPGRLDELFEEIARGRAARHPVESDRRGRP
jgi:glycosyltransferase involved in cell wall biosynthesis